MIVVGTNLAETEIGENDNHVRLDSDDEPRVARVLASQHLHVVARPEELVQLPRVNCDRLLQCCCVDQISTLLDAVLGKL